LTVLAAPVIYISSDHCNKLGWEFPLTEFKVNGVSVEDTFCETFNARIARILVTSINTKWAYESALEAKGLGRSATIPPSEATLEGPVDPENSPDGRPGFTIQVMDRKVEQLKEWLIIRMRKGIVPYPKTNVFDALPREMAEDFVEVRGTMIQTFGDGFEEEKNIFGRQVFRIPRMDGWFHVETKFGLTKGVGGGMFLILAKSEETALRAAEEAVESIKTVPFVVGKLSASGTKIGGGKYTHAIATTNDAYCSVLRGKTESRIPSDTNCVYEIIVSGLRMEDVTRAMATGIEKATKVSGVSKITASNYAGTLGKGKIYLKSLFSL
jgi:formylmethanofuran--tetrahydromethanopterin N-formyltransferase